MGTVAIIGDSLTYRADDNPANSREALTRGRFVTAGWDAADVYWYARGGKKMDGADSSGETVADNITAARALLDVDQWVIALGTNDVDAGQTGFRSRVSAVLDLIYPTGDEPDQAYWLTYTAMNAANTNFLNATSWLRAELAARTDLADRTHLLEWATYIHSTGVYDDADWLPADVPHMTPQGYAKRDAFIIDALGASSPGAQSIHVIKDGTLAPASMVGVIVDGQLAPATL